MPQSRPWRVPTIARLAVLVNVAIWIGFLIAGQPVEPEEWARIDLDRQTQSGISIIKDGPLTVAGRWYGTFGAINTADMVLTMAAGPAIDLSEAIIVPLVQSGIPASQGESYVIAAIAFTVSTAWWYSVGLGVDFVIKKLRRRR